MVKIKKIYTKKRHTVSSREMKKFFGIEKEEIITNFGLWSGRSPNSIKNGADANTDEWYIETNDGVDD